MPDKFARQSGNYNHPIWALTTSGIAGSTTVPDANDIASSNSFSVTITGSVFTSRLRNSNGGIFILADQCVVNGNVETSSTGSNGTFRLNTTSDTATIIGTIGLQGVPGGSHMYTHNGGVLNVLGNVETGDGGANSSIILTTGVINVIGGSVLANSGGFGRQNTVINGGVMNVIGNVAGDSGGFSTISMSSGGSLNVTGNIIGHRQAGVAGTANTIKLVGSATASINASAISISSGTVRVTGNILSAPGGRVGIYSPNIILENPPSQSFIRYARNNSGLGSDAFFFQYTPDTVSQFSVPPVGQVREGVVYGGGTLTGTCKVPPTSAVAFGVAYDSNGSKTGIAFNGSNIVFAAPIDSINTPNSIGVRLKKAATIESVGHLVASFSN